MVTKFIVKAKDKLHRIYIDSDAWKNEGIEVGDYIEVTVRKIE